MKKLLIGAAVAGIIIGLGIAGHVQVKKLMEDLEKAI